MGTWIRKSVLRSLRALLIHVFLTMSTNIERLVAPDMRDSHNFLLCMVIFVEELTIIYFWRIIMKIFWYLAYILRILCLERYQGRWWIICSTNADWILNEHEWWAYLFPRILGETNGDGFFISQIKYSQNTVKKIGLENVCQKLMFIVTHNKLSKDERWVSIDQSLYKSMVGRLLYLTNACSNTTLSIGVCAM